MPDLSVICLTLKLAVIVTLLLALATPLAWWLAQTDSKLKAIIGSNIPEETHVLSVEIYNHVEAMEYAQAHWPAGGMMLVSFIGLLLIYCINYQCKGKQSLNSQSQSRQSANNQAQRRLVI